MCMTERKWKGVRAILRRIVATKSHGLRLQILWIYRRTSNTTFYFNFGKELQHQGIVEKFLFCLQNPVFLGSIFPSFSEYFSEFFRIFFRVFRSIQGALRFFVYKFSDNLGGCGYKLADNFWGICKFSDNFSKSRFFPDLQTFDQKRRDPGSQDLAFFWLCLREIQLFHHCNIPKN